MDNLQANYTIEPVTMTCNKCGLVADQIQEWLALNDLHTFTASFGYSNQYPDLDMQECTFILCTKCLFDIFNTFKVQPEFEDTKGWVDAND